MTRRSRIVSLLVALSAIAILIAVIVPLHDSRAKGKDIAKRLIELSENGTKPVDLPSFGDKVCIVAESLSGRINAKQLFPDYAVSYVESDDSEGVWFFLQAHSARKEVEVKAISQRILRWPVSRDTRDWHIAVQCPRSLRVLIAPDRVPEIEPVKEGQ